MPALTQAQTPNGDTNGNSFISGYITLLLRAEPFSTGRFQQPGLNMPYGVVGIENICEIAARLVFYDYFLSMAETVASASALKMKIIGWKFIHIYYIQSQV